MIIDIKKLEDIRYQFAQLGRSITGLSAQTDLAFDAARSGVEKLKVSLAGLVEDSGLKEVLGFADHISEYADKFISTIDTLNEKMGSLESLDSSVKNAAQKFAKISTDLDNLARVAPTKGGSRQGLSSLGGHVAEQRAAMESDKRQVGKFESYMRKELKGVTDSMKKFWGNLHLPKLGHVLATAVIWMGFSVKKEQESKQDIGKAANIAVTAVDGTAKNMVDVASQHLGEFGRSLEKYYGIATSELEAVQTAFASAGVSIRDYAMKGLGKDLGAVGDSLSSYTLALDKMFELSGGTTADRMTGFMRDFGMSVDKSRESVERMMFLGRESGIGAEYFTKTIEGMQESLADMGFSVDKLIDLSFVMQKRWEEVGVPKHLAGKEAALGLQGIAQGLAKMDDNWQVFIGEIMGFGKGLEAKHKYEDSVARITREGGADEFVDMIVKLADTLQERIGDYHKAMEVMANNTQFGYKGAKAAMEMSRARSSGDPLKVDVAKKALLAFREDLKKSFETEKQKQNQFQLATNKWMEGLSKIGRGLLSVVGKLLSWFIAFMRHLPDLIANAVTGKSGANEQLMDKLNAWAFKGLDKDVEDMKKGAKTAKDAMKEMGEQTLGDVFDTITDSFSIMFEGIGSSLSKAPERPGGGTGGGGGKGPYVQIITIPSATPGTYGSYPVSGGPVRPRDLRSAGEVPVSSYNVTSGSGGRLSLISSGVDEQGNIKITLVGNCPFCGAAFGPSGSTVASSDAEAGIGSGISFVNPNTGKRQRIDVSTAKGLQDLTDLSITHAARRKAKEKGEKLAAVDPALGGLLQNISEHFGNKNIKVYRGVAASGGGEHTKGRAADISVEGVSNKALYDYLLKTHKGGKGYYPNQPFVHVDVGKNATWVDFSKKGEASAGKTLGGASARQWFNQYGSTPQEGKSPTYFSSTARSASVPKQGAPAATATPSVSSGKVSAPGKQALAEYASGKFNQDFDNAVQAGLWTEEMEAADLARSKLPLPGEV